MDEEIKRTMEELSEGMRQLAESFGTQSKFMNEKFEKDKQYASWEEEDRKREKANSKEVREAEIKHLGYYRDEFGIIRESVDLRKSENQQKKEAIAQIKKEVGEKEFLHKQQQRLLADELDKIEQNNGAFATMARNASMAAKAMAAPGEAIRTYTTEHGRQLNSFGSIVGATTDKMYDAAKGSIGWTMAIGAAEAATHLLVGSFMGAYKSFETMGKGLLNGERGMSLAAAAVSARAEELGKATETAGTILTGLGASALALRIGLTAVLGPIGWVTAGISALAAVLGIGIKVYGDYQKKFAEVNALASTANDKLFTGFNELGKMSMTTAGGMEDLAEQTHKLGMGGQVDKFTSMIARSSKELKTFGITAADGLNKFTEVATTLFKDEASKMFERMGIPLEEQYDHTIKYIALQNRLGLAQGKTVADLEKGAKAYLEELEKTAALTGASRKSQEEAREAVYAIQSAQAALLDEQQRLERGDKGAKKRIEEIETFLTIATNLQAKGLTVQAKGAADTAAGNNSVEALQYQRANADLIREIRAGERDTTYLTIKALNSNTKQVTEVASTIRRTGRAEDTYGISSEDPSKTVKNKADLAALNEAMAAERKRLGANFNEKEFITKNADLALKALQAQEKGKDGKASATQQQIDIRRAEAEGSSKVDAAAIKFLKSADVNMAAALSFQKTVKTLEDYFKDSAPIRGRGNTGSSGGASGAATAPVTRSSRSSSPMRGRGGVGQPTTGASASKIRFQGDALGNKEHFDALNGDVKEKFTQMIDAYGKPVQVNAAYRSEEEQAKMYADATPGPDGRRYNKFGNPVAPPGGSNHNFGRAIDLNTSDVDALDAGGFLRDFGFNRVAGDRPHIEMARTGGVFSGPSSGYPVMLHGREAVVPQANFKDIKKETLSAATSSASPGSDEVVGLLADMVETMSSKLDEVINKLGDGNDIQGKILTYSMA